jgi:cbb3-type cytochrome oxidase maturation protein
MSIIILLLGISVLVALGFLGAFLWAGRTGQFDDTVTPAQRILFDPIPKQAPTPTQPSLTDHE